MECAKVMGQQTFDYSSSAENHETAVENIKAVEKIVVVIVDVASSDTLDKITQQARINLETLLKGVTVAYDMSCGFKENL